MMPTGYGTVRCRWPSPECGLLATATETGRTGARILRADSEFSTADVAAACRCGSDRFSITTGNPSTGRAIATIPADAWRQVRFPNP
ncbi:hypothetical protein OG417_06020 [Actinoallomurus sp. NBC_01490]|jgi:hypothetical protein|uniref:hypothetical protein n=1 Tax=Actinoallomurus sp. NBC_01490 TaxID=2903557 RepID=UPI002E334402|nr:hypothetical protein [Actinoallomurus sp. NBC_01490]